MPKKLNIAKDKEDIMKMVEMTMEAFPTSFFVDNLQIPEDQIRSFIYSCTGDPVFREIVAKSKQLELLEYLRKKALDFLEYKSDQSLYEQK